MQLQRPCLPTSNQTVMALNCSATYGRSPGMFRLTPPHHHHQPPQKALRGLFLKVLKPPLRGY